MSAMPVTFAGLGKIAARLKPGATGQVNVMRNGAQQPLALKIGQLPDPPAETAFTCDADTWVPNLALGVANVTPAIRKALKADEESGGVIVTRLRSAGVPARSQACGQATSSPTRAPSASPTSQILHGYSSLRCRCPWCCASCVTERHA
jgi:hypothetical protein